MVVVLVLSRDTLLGLGMKLGIPSKETIADDL